MLALATRDLQYRGMRDERLRSFSWKQKANFLLYRRVQNSVDAVEYEALRQEWDQVNRPAYSKKRWSDAQQEALDVARAGVSYDDEETRRASRRWMHAEGPPGSGKSAVLLEMAIEHCPHMGVELVCPTGYLVHQCKSRLPDMPGIENITVDTMQGCLRYKRPGSDSKVEWAPPSALRKKDLFLIDEASQYEDADWENYFKSIMEQPHRPFQVITGDFQQLQPVVSGGQCRKLCDTIHKIALTTVYRSTDPAHLVFLNRIRVEQPKQREMLEEYFGDRHWKGVSLQECVQRGMRLAESEGEPFSWLCTTSAGAAEVCGAALVQEGLSSSDLEHGYLPDPSSKSPLRIVARPGILVRLEEL